MTRTVPRLVDEAAHALLKTAFGMTQRGHYRRLLTAAKDPAATQEALLRRVLAANAESTFAKDRGLSRVRTIEDYRQAVPVQSYEDLRPLIERQEMIGERCLTHEQPVYYHRTSGTLGAPKNIPVTKTGLRAIRDHQRVSGYVQATQADIFRGKIFAVTGQAIEGRMAGGTPFGSASGLLYQNQSRFVRARYVLPPALSDIHDYEERYLAMAIHGLAARSVSCIATANPSTLVRLLSTIHDNLDLILETIATGLRPDRGEAPAEAGTRFRPDPARASQLAQAARGTAALSYADIWPELRGLVTWTSGSCALPLRRLEGLLPEATKVIELGYLASEVRGTLPVDLRRGLCLPTLLDNLFEFVERAAWESGSGDFLSLHQLEERQEYYIFVTTADGLYRYDMNDIVRVTGLVERTPTLAFVQKGKGVTNITGEKLSESQVLAAVLAMANHRGLETGFFVLLADQENARYRLYLEPQSPRLPGTGDPRTDDLARALDKRLRQTNIEYDAKRESGRLAPLILRRLQPGTGERYRRARVAGGQRDAQFKVQHLQYLHECGFDFETLCEPE